MLTNSIQFFKKSPFLNFFKICIKKSLFCPKIMHFSKSNPANPAELGHHSIVTRYVHISMYLKKCLHIVQGFNLNSYFYGVFTIAVLIILNSGGFVSFKIVIIICNFLILTRYLKPHETSRILYDENGYNKNLKHKKCVLFTRVFQKLPFLRIGSHKVVRNAL